MSSCVNGAEIVNAFPLLSVLIIGLAVPGAVLHHDVDRCVDRGGVSTEWRLNQELALDCLWEGWGISSSSQFFPSYRAWALGMQAEQRPLSIATSSARSFFSYPLPSLWSAAE